VELSATPRRHRESHRQSVRGTPKETFRACYYGAYSTLRVRRERCVPRAFAGVSSLRALRALAGDCPFIAQSAHRRYFRRQRFGDAIGADPRAPVWSAAGSPNARLGYYLPEFSVPAAVRSLVEELRSRDCQ